MREDHSSLLPYAGTRNGAAGVDPQVTDLLQRVMATIKRVRATPAKISSPRVTQPYLRTRLFKSLDAVRNRPLVWISGPAGAGKTTLAISYLNARHLKFLWYRFDARDADPAAFFYYLREAASRSWPRKRENLPLADA
jgi:LuxR family transcriptional regulator, maltose regulon positive regulatory protein